MLRIGKRAALSESNEDNEWSSVNTWRKPPARAGYPQARRASL